MILLVLGPSPWCLGVPYTVICQGLWQARETGGGRKGNLVMNHSCHIALYDLKMLLLKIGSCE